MIDLHMHSTCSDGSLTPSELVAMAGEIGLKAIALTDHDTIDGVGELLDAAAATDIAAITGVELSAECSPGTMHILGYHVDAADRDLREKLEWIRCKRGNRNRLILARLNEVGLELTWDEVAACAGSDLVGRPHFAQAIIARGYCSRKKEVFDKYLAKGKKAYIDRRRLAPQACIEMIRNAGGVAVLAHPITLKLSYSRLRRRIEELVDMGLGGIECYYPQFSPAEHRHISDIARDLGLVMTGGSDFHGADSPAVRMGCGFGNLNVPDQLLRPLLLAKPAQTLVCTSR